MAASYPGGFDTMSDPSANLSGPPLHSTMHNQINDVIEAIEAELGLNPSGADATVAATLAALATRYAALEREIAYAEASGAQATFGPAITDITGATVTFTAVSTRKYLIQGKANIVQNTSAGSLLLTLTNAANTVFDLTGFANATAGHYFPLAVFKRVTGLSGSQTFKLRASTTAGTMTMNHGSTFPTILCVTEIGGT